MNAPFLNATPLHAWHLRAGGRMAEFAGYELPIQYRGIVEEHHACRSAAAVFDVSHMGRLRFDGEGSEQLLDRLLTRRAVDLAVGRVRYALVCNESGGVIDDTLVSHLQTPSGSRYHLLVVNASNRAKVIEHIRPHLDDFPKVTFTDRTELTAMIAIQGPLARDVCQRLFRARTESLGRYQAVITDQFGKPAIVSRTGYTGEDGLELIVRAEEAERVWENLLLAGRSSGFLAAGLGARDSLRLEAGLPLYGHELTEQIDPLSAGLAFACDLDDRDFIGRAALQRVQQAGPPFVRVGLLPEDSRPLRGGATITDARGRQVGYVTSGGPSPTLGRPIAMAMLEAPLVTTGTATPPALLADNRGRQQTVTVVPLPFYRRPVRKPPTD